MKKAVNTKGKLPAIDFQRLAKDFQDLNPNDPGMWPLAPRVAVFVGLLLAQQHDLLTLAQMAGGLVEVGAGRQAHPAQLDQLGREQLTPGGERRLQVPV